MSQLVRQLACQFARGSKRDTQKSLCTFNDEHHNKYDTGSVFKGPV